jgi:sialic acid synthase SpsE
VIDVLRPAPAEAIKPDELEQVLGKRLLVDLKQGQELRWELLGA